MNYSLFMLNADSFAHGIAVGVSVSQNLIMDHIDYIDEDKNEAIINEYTIKLNLLLPSIAHRNQILKRI